ncbi:MAG: carbamoyltransferase [Deltaproteobacteria bacterium]|nr:carbamoyltransferase [Deltaproteobacteria bacterium]
MKAVLGISAFYHDAAAALVVDGKVVAAAQEERFTRLKHDADFPVQAIGYCLKEAGITPADLDAVGFYEKPLAKFDRLLETYVAFAPAGFMAFLKSLPVWLQKKLYLPREIRKGLAGGYQKAIVFCEHHEAHAASAFFPSPFAEAAILTMDGVGEWATSSIGVGHGHQVELLYEQHFPHSLGLLYSAFTYFTGFKVNSGEYKLMGLAPYGEPRYVDRIYDQLIDLKEDGSFRMDQSYFDYCAGLVMTSKKFATLFDGPPRAAESKLTDREMDIAASIQVVTEEIVMRMAKHAHAVTGQKNLCLAGGVALNCVANGKLLSDGPFERLWIQPAAGDAGGALGVALLIWHQLMENARTPAANDSQSGSLLGPAFSFDQVKTYLDGVGAKYQVFETDAALIDHVAGLMASEKVIGWFQGRMEFGPRALGSRSILGDARSRQMQSVMNLKIKFRESFRPFAPVVLEERVHEYFDTPEHLASPYMLLVANVKHDKRLPTNGADQALKGIDKLKFPRSVVPAITHVDYSARLQTADRERHGRYYELIKRFEEKTGCPVIINTSFNVRGEPIVCTPADAFRCFMATEMDVLVLDRCVLLKEDQPKGQGVDREGYLRQFKLD